MNSYNHPLIKILQIHIIAPLNHEIQKLVVVLEVGFTSLLAEVEGLLGRFIGYSSFFTGWCQVIGVGLLVSCVIGIVIVCPLLC